MPRREPSISPARRAAYQLLSSCLTEKATLLDALDEFSLDAAGGPDAALAREIALGTCRWLGRLRHALMRFVRNWEGLPPPVHRILELSAYQLLFLDRVPAYAILSDAVDMTRWQRCGGLAKTVNGILRNLDRNRGDIRYPDVESDLPGFLSVTQSHPRWLANRWLGCFGDDDTRRLCVFNNERAPLSMRLRDREAALAWLQSNEIKYTLDERFGDRVELASPPPGCFDQTFWLAQDGAAMLASACAGARPGHLIWDVCAAPGGKTFALADRLQQQGEIVASDRSAARLERLDAQLERLGLDIVRSRVFDLLRDRLDFDREFDIVLVDAPCTGWGAFRRRPDLRWRLEAGDEARLAKDAGVMLRRCADAVKPGGALVYSTCTLSPLENRGVIERFLNERSDFAIEPPTDDLPPAFRTAVDSHGAMNLFAPDWQLDGAFAARLRRH